MLLLKFSIFLLLQNFIKSKNIQIETPSGKLKGTTLKTRLGKTIYTFRGIRYAQSPVGNLRFKDPILIETWSGTYNATADAPMCPQPGSAPTSEDCLFLNVYSTKLPDNSASPKRPVVVMLHSGGFYSGSGRSSGEGPQYFLDRDIVLVTLNYRLSSLGFLSVGKEAPGNYGLKDQVAAMKWVQKNIAAFGGDPDAVTLYGYSAGGFSVMLHLVSPMSKGLFHKAIIGSGIELGPWPLYNNQLDVAKKQARLLGCPDTCPKEIVDCLRTKPAEDFGNSIEQFRVWGSTLTVTWSPVIEEDFGQERFLTEQPITGENAGFGRNHQR